MLPIHVASLSLFEVFVLNIFVIKIDNFTAAHRKAVVAMGGKLWLLTHPLESSFPTNITQLMVWCVTRPGRFSNLPVLPNILPEILVRELAPQASESWTAKCYQPSTVVPRLSNIWYTYWLLGWCVTLRMRLVEKNWKAYITYLLKVSTFY